MCQETRNNLTRLRVTQVPTKFKLSHYPKAGSLASAVQSQTLSRAEAPPRDSVAGRTFGAERALFLALGAITLLYALFAGLRTVSDYDIGWQLASGRWMAQHHRIFSTDVFSYPAAGAPWIYPIGAGLLFYGAYLLGGYMLLSWIGAIACAGTVALLLRRGTLTSAALSIVAMVCISYRTIPRADMFTVVLFAAYLSILWENYQTGRARLWLLPPLMIAWVNLHLGFVAGLGLVGAFAGLELLEMLFGGVRRHAAMQRLRRGWPWFAATVAVTVLNPWGWNIYEALIRQNEAMARHAQYLTEWLGLPLTWASITSSLSLRDPQGAVYLMLAIAIVAAVAALWQRQPGPAILLLAAVYQSVKHIRMEALTACVVVVVGGSVLHSAMVRMATRIPKPALRKALAISLTGIFAAIAGMNASDILTNRRYLIRNDVATFGTGIGWWYPERAMEFIANANLPGEILNTYDEGGFFLWKLGEQHRDYVDGRAIPFGLDIFQRQQELLQASLDSPLWQQTAERYNINVFVLSLARLHLRPLLRLKDFCDSHTWRPVYLDEVSAVFVRRTPQTEDFIQRSAVDCATTTLPLQPVADTRATSFNQWANAAAVLAALGRSYEAITATDTALQIFADSGYVHWLRGNLFAYIGRNGDGEEEFLKAASLDPSENTWSSLAMVYRRDGRLPEAKRAMQEAARLSFQPHLANLRLARFYLSIEEPQLAQQALDEALRQAPAGALAETGSDSLRFQVARNRAEAWGMLGDRQQAIASDEAATQLDATDPQTWWDLAKLYGDDGRQADQQRAQKRAAELASGNSESPLKQ